MQGTAAKDFKTAFFNSSSTKKGIALVVPMSGLNESLGKNIIDAANLAVADVASTGLQIQLFDSQLPFAELATKIEEMDPAIIIGPIFGNQAYDLAEKLNNKDLCMITFSNDAEIVKTDSCIFLLGVMPEQSIKDILEYAIKQDLKINNALIPNNKYGALIKSHIDKKNINIISYDPSKSMANQPRVGENIAKLNASAGSGEAILIPEGRFLKIIAADYNLNNYKIISGGLWEDENLYSLPIANKAWFSTLPFELRQQFDNNFQIQFGYKPTKIASLAYDAVTLVNYIYKTSGESVITRDSLTSRKGFKGINGTFRFTKNGINERNFSIYEINSGTKNTIKPANTAFKN